MTFTYATSLSPLRPGSFTGRGVFFFTGQDIETKHTYKVLNIFFHKCTRPRLHRREAMP